MNKTRIRESIAHARDLVCRYSCLKVGKGLLNSAEKEYRSLIKDLGASEYDFSKAISILQLEYQELKKYGYRLQKAFSSHVRITPRAHSQPRASPVIEEPKKSEIPRKIASVQKRVVKVDERPRSRQHKVSPRKTPRRVKKKKPSIPRVFGKKKPKAKVFVPKLNQDKELARVIEREIIDQQPGIKFEQIAGLEYAKEILTESVVLPALRPEFFTGIRQPWKGILLFGPPGTGKTMLAKAIATECKTKFFNISPSSLTSKWRGESSKLVRLLFEMARFYAPSTIFIDEIDALGGERGNTQHEASRRMKSELLIQMDGVGTQEPSQRVVVLAATNHPWELDMALRRRLEKRIYVPLPEDKGRESIIRENMSNTEHSLVTEDILNIVKKCKGFSGADVTLLCRDASMMSIRRALHGKTIDEIKGIDTNQVQPVQIQDFEAAILKQRPSVSSEQVLKFDAWNSKFGSN